MSGRSFNGPEFLSQACRCPCCSQRVTWHKAVWSGACQAKCRTCSTQMTFDLATGGNPFGQPTVGNIMNDWSRIVEDPRLINERCACRA